MSGDVTPTYEDRDQTVLVHFKTSAGRERVTFPSMASPIAVHKGDRASELLPSQTTSGSFLRANSHPSKE
jgi:hypothetical protein